ncbi:MAG: hypothetical protein ACREIV_12720 [Planctomycetaceae bacterium]
MKITVETAVKAPLNRVWDASNNPADIKEWNSAQDDWHTTKSSVDLSIPASCRKRRSTTE